MMYFKPLEFFLWALGCVTVVATVFFFLGKAHTASKTNNELKKLRKLNDMLKRLTPKLKWGEDIKGPNEYEIAIQGNPKDA